MFLNYNSFLKTGCVPFKIKESVFLLCPTQVALLWNIAVKSFISHCITCSNMEPRGLYLFLTHSLSFPCHLLLLFPNLSKLGFLYVPAAEFKISPKLPVHLSIGCVSFLLFGLQSVLSPTPPQKLLPVSRQNMVPPCLLCLHFFLYRTSTTCRSSDYDWGFPIFTHSSIFGRWISSITKCPCIHEFLRNTLRKVSMLVI